MEDLIVAKIHLWDAINRIYCMRNSLDKNIFLTIDGIMRECLRANEYITKVYRDLSEED